MLSEAARPVCTFIASPVHCVCALMCAHTTARTTTVCLIALTLECLSYRELGANQSFNVRTLIGWKDVCFVASLCHSLLKVNVFFFFFFFKRGGLTLGEVHLHDLAPPATRIRGRVLKNKKIDILVTRCKIAEGAKELKGEIYSALCHFDTSAATSRHSHESLLKKN